MRDSVPTNLVWAQCITANIWVLKPVSIRVRVSIVFLVCSACLCDKHFTMWGDQAMTPSFCGRTRLAWNCTAIFALQKWQCTIRPFLISRAMCHPNLLGWGTEISWIKALVDCRIVSCDFSHYHTRTSLSDNCPAETFIESFIFQGQK